ncbi:C4-dicarboxylate transporter DctA [Parafilimonas terrae]|uniref:Aerobic C4-dicarboxylate transport protein n=1 Tax=Parafilimonas terrae TaxID=1465490 RepID=A0A1I5RPI1_9BACT|nr:C4-dicarboxylate transporter DctA [Parafilimonas terrae]SFP60310.1 aerobic C4-dicarboxylate transport protein [Parafilimonas terrae]
MKKLFTNLTFWVLVAITAGALLGNFYPGTAIKMKVFGDYFIVLIKYFIYPIIFLTISLGISNMGDLKKTGRVGGKALLYFEIVTTFALLIGIIVSHFIQPGRGVDISSIKGGDISAYIKESKEFSWLQFLKDNPTLQILIVAIIFGIWLSRYNKKEIIITPLTNISRYVFKALHFVMLLAPLGAFGGMAYTIGKFGIHTLLPLIRLMVCVYITCLCFIFIVLGLLLRYYNISILKFLKYIRNELLIVLGTSSSEAALPSLIEKLERMGCTKSVTGLVVPAGYSFNLDGTTIYLSMAVMFLAQVYNIELTLHQVFVIIGVLLVTSKGAAGVTGSGFIVLASTLTAVKVIPIEGLAFLLGVDRFMSEARALTNFIGNGVATIWLSNNEKEFDRSKMNEVLYGQGNRE